MFRSTRRNMDEIEARGLAAGFDHSILSAAQFGAAVVFAHNDQWAALLPHLASEFARFAICQWHKTNPMPVANRHYQPDTEIYVHAWNPGFHPSGELAQKQRFLIAPNGQDSAIQHPTVKPLAVMRKILVNVNGNSVCDPFMGSGTTGVASVEAGRRFIGIEAHEPYFDLACRRVEQAHNQPRLFDEPAPAKPVQPSLLDGEAA